MKKISKEVKDLTVVYDNNLNKIANKELNIYELNLLYGLLSRLKINPDEEIILSYDYINMLAGRNGTGKPTATNEFLEKFSQRIASSTYMIKSGKDFAIYPIFSEAKSDYSERTFTISLNQKINANLFLKDITSNFTKFEFNSYYSLPDKYSKSLFRLLSQYKSTGIYRIKVEDLKFLLGTNVDLKTKEFHKVALYPAIDNLLKTEDISLLDLELIKKGNKIVSYEFKFKFKKQSKENKRKEISEEYTDEEIVAGLQQNINWENDNEREDL